MIILADDITGAAEVAGAASARGHRVRLVCGGGNASLPKEAPEANIITVIATDMRSMTADEAIAETRRIAALLAPVGESAVGKSAIPSQTPPSPWEGRGGVLAHHLREMTAALIHHLVAIRMPQQLILEGGASAFAALRHLGWNKLEVVSQLAPGVILTKAPNGTFVIMKPGSYPWGEALSFENFEPRMRRL